MECAKPPSRHGRDFFGNDFSYVLLRALADVASHAMRNAAYRGMQRRGPIRRKQRQRTGRPRFPDRGFTNSESRTECYLVKPQQLLPESLENPCQSPFFGRRWQSDCL